MKNPALDPLRLRFSGELEDIFQEDYFRKSIKPLRIGMILASMIYALFGILDAQVFPEVRAATWFVRYAVVCPVCIAGILYAFSSRFKNHVQTAMFLLILAGGAGIIAMMVLVHSPENYFHYAGLLLVIMYSYTFSKLSFHSATLACWTLVGLYEFAALRIMHVPLPVFLNDNFFYISANLIGMFSCYHRELYTRKDFLQTLTIREFEGKKRLLEKENILRDLHDGIGGITTNIGLLAEMGHKAATVRETRDAFATIADLSREGLAEIRTIMRSLDPTPKTWQELAAELRRQGSTMVEPHGISFQIRSSVGILRDQPGKMLWLNLFRIYREALTNIMKHSMARAVTVELIVDNDGLLLSVCDNGIGMKRNGDVNRGIPNIMARAREIGGEAVISSRIGTAVCVALPFPIQLDNE